MITIQKQDGKYCVHHKGRQLGFIELYGNPQHATNCYVKIELSSWETSISEELWRKLKEISGRPLQVMVDSSNVAITDFLTAGGFVCKRKCYEVDACAADYVGGIVDMVVRIFYQLLVSGVGYFCGDCCNYLDQFAKLDWADAYSF